MHVIGSPAGDPIRLCDGHFKEVSAAGLVTDPNIGEAEYQRRESERLGGLKGSTRRRGWFGRKD